MPYIVPVYDVSSTYGSLILIKIRTYVLTKRTEYLNRNLRSFRVDMR